MSLAKLPLQSSASLTSSRCRFSLPVPNPALNAGLRFRPTRHAGIRASAEPEPSQTSDSTSAVKEPAAGKAAAGKGFGKAPQQPAVVRRPAPSQPLLSTQPMGEEEKKAAEIETAVVASLGFVFVLIILEGLFLAAAGACGAGNLCVQGNLMGVGGGGRIARKAGGGRWWVEWGGLGGAWWVIVGMAWLVGRADESAYRDGRGGVAGVRGRPHHPRGALPRRCW
ncbi:unnamed protein product [Closterium sp. NIES-54]